jgi:beta-barrel assembly-enhancing protease
VVRAAGLLILLVAVGCAGLQRVAGDIVLPPEDEVALGRQLATELEANLDLHPDPAIQDYVADLGAQIVAAIGDPRPEVEWHFKVIDAPEDVNAVALPGGWIYLTSGLLLLVETEAELVGILAHEIAHVTRRHIAERLATIYGLEILAAVALGQDPGTLERIVTTVLAQGYLLRYSRDQEREADAYGAEYAIAARWDPRGLIWFFEHLVEAPRPPTWLATHPSPDARIELLEAQLSGREPLPSRVGRARYDSVRARVAEPPVPVGTRMPSGPDPGALDSRP